MNKIVYILFILRYNISIWRQLAMNKEIKIVLAIKGERALYFFKRKFKDFTEVKFVVGWANGNPAVGDFVSG